MELAPGAQKCLGRTSESAYLRNATTCQPLDLQRNVVLQASDLFRKDNGDAENFLAHAKSSRHCIHWIVTRVFWMLGRSHRILRSVNSWDGIAFIGLITNSIFPLPESELGKEAHNEALGE